jgi:hypothetical protein
MVRGLRVGLLPAFEHPLLELAKRYRLFERASLHGLPVWSHLTTREPGLPLLVESLLSRLCIALWAVYGAWTVVAGVPVTLCLLRTALDRWAAVDYLLRWGRRAWRWRAVDRSLYGHILRHRYFNGLSVGNWVVLNLRRRRLQPLYVVVRNRRWRINAWIAVIGLVARHWLDLRLAHPLHHTIHKIVWDLLLTTVRLYLTVCRPHLFGSVCIWKS